MEEQTEELHEGTRYTGGTGSVARRLPRQQKAKPQRSVWHAEATTGFRPPPELFLETEATLTDNVVKFVGLRHLTQFCSRSGIRSMERLSTGDIIIRGWFQAVDDMNGQVIRLMAKNKGCIAFELAFSESATIARELKVVTDEEEEETCVPRMEGRVSEEDSREQRLPHAANDDNQEQGSVPPSTDYTETSQNPNTEAGEGAGNQTEELSEDVDNAERTIQHRSSVRTKTSIPTSTCLTLKTGHRIVIKKGDITSDNADVIVIDVSRDLQHGTHLVNAAGEEAMVEERREIVQKRQGKISEGEAIRAGPGKLPCHYVVYAVTPGWRSLGRHNDHGNMELVLKNACLNSLKRAEEVMVSTVVLPFLGSTLSRAPKAVCAMSMLDAAETFFATRPHATVKEVRFIDADEDTVHVFELEARKRSSASCAVSNPEPLPECDPDPFGSGSNTGKDCDYCRDLSRHGTILVCGHSICKNCIDDRRLNTTCPVCEVKPKGPQPEGGSMTCFDSKISLPGFEGVRTIVITYHIPPGIQGPTHPNPGGIYEGISKTTYLPDNQEGRELTSLLRKAFDASLLFTIGTSISTGNFNPLIWNGMQQQTSVRGGPQQQGYPDEDYLKRLRADLKAKGIQ